ncbi:InlB B-repeat-containing protein [Fibrobacter sp.]|uniref:InlB B-repeat-containing protein n=1 Tax=Fibrobacter sp. TaxID=35828 RepID=UPI003863CE7D
MLCRFRRIWVLFICLVLATSFADARTITYILNGGTNHPDNPTSYGNEITKKIELKPATREGYAFLGWYIESASACTVSPNWNFESSFKGDPESYISHILGDFTVSARWGLVPKTPQIDERGCYLIHSAEELYGLRNVFYVDGRYSIVDPACVSLQNDIVVNKNLLDAEGNLSLDDYVWWPSLNFFGTFDGNGFSISGLRGEGGLFDFLERRSVVRNLGIKDSYFSANTAGGLVGTVDWETWIYNVFSEASVHGTQYAGGLVGKEVISENCVLTAPAISADYVHVLDRKRSNASSIENAYSLGIVEGGTVGGIAASMNQAVLNNVFFLGKLQGLKSDCIVAVKEPVCSAGDSVFVIENALCMDSKDTSVSKATSLSKEQFADGTALNILSKNDDLRWSQKIGTDPHPVFGEVKVEIRYVLNGGENNEKNPRYFTVGDKPIALSEPHKANDVFEGWFLDSAFTNKVDSIDTRNLDDRILYAKWKSRFIITLEMGLYRGSYDKQYCYGSCKIEWSTDSSTFVLEKAYSDGYTFDGWYVDSLFTKEIKEIPEDNTDDITVYVKWKPVVYTITYHLVGGVNHPDNPTTYTVLESPKVKDPTREGAVFLSWRVEKPYEWANPTWPEPPTNRDYYAQWIPVPQKPLKDSTGCYLVTSKEELYWIEQSADRKWCASLQNDIVVNENMIKDSKLNLDTNSYFVWRPIAYFEGKFLGNGHSISGLYLKSGDGYESYDAYKYGGLFKSVQRDAKIFNVEVNDSYCDGLVEHLVIASVVNNKIALPKILPKSTWHIAVSGNVVAMSGLMPGKTLLVMDVQGRVLRKLRTESSMNIDFPSAGRFLVRYGNEIRAISIR